MIDDPATSEAQKINLQTAIKLYHEHELPERFKWIQDGKVVRHKDIDFRRPYWVEIRLWPATMIPTIEPESSPILITGSNNGIGREAAVQFVKRDANLILACQQPPSYETHPGQVIEECKAAGEAYGQYQIVEWWECDMADLSSVEALAKRWIESGRPLDVLVNNAGMSQRSGKVVLTKDGFELCHQVNFLSNTLLTLRLLPFIAKAPSPRIICTTSCFHYLGIYDLSNVNAGTRAYSDNKLYFQIWLSDLQLRLLRHPDYDHIVVHGVHPGYVKSSISKPVDKSNTTQGNIDPVFWALSTLFICFAIDSYQGSLALVNAATMPEFGLQAAGTDEFRGGAGYFNRIWMDDPSPYTRDATS
ncbi:hypothetical protein McanCB49686_003780 [Microsporum canis]